jgi:ectoine hydroxylase-related dioxygenase (phytanoyl-CoA dioxygenase family)
MKNILTQGILPGIASTIHNTNITLYKEKINYKYFNTGSYRPHQDITAYPNSHNHITLMIPLCDTNKLNGCIEFSPIQNKTIYNHNDGIIQNTDNLDFTPCPTIFGDILLFNSYVPHKSGINQLHFPRRVLYITYNDLKEGDLRELYYKEKKKT